MSDKLKKDIIMAVVRLLHSEYNKPIAIMVPEKCFEDLYKELSSYDYYELKHVWPIKDTPDDIYRLGGTELAEVHIFNCGYDTYQGKYLKARLRAIGVPRKYCEYHL